MYKLVYNNFTTIKNKKKHFHFWSLAITFLQKCSLLKWTYATALSVSWYLIYPSLTFLTAACCPKRDFYTHTHTHTLPFLKNSNRLLYCMLKIARHLYSVLKKACQIADPKKVAKRQQKCSKKGGEKSLFLNLSCCCLETGLKLILFMNTIAKVINHFSLQICKLKFPAKLKWLTHMRRSHDKRSDDDTLTPFLCDSCPKFFSV